MVDQATRHGSASAVIAADLADAGFAALKAPIKQVTALDTTIAYSAPLEAYALPDADKVADAVRQVLGAKVAA
jgi:pyruvate/2-oxoglutarate/acetoin dehydrogenase E1 component